MSSQEVVTYVRKGVADKVPLETLCERTMDHCLASDIGMTGVGCDNMTMVIVAILNGKTLEEWYEHIAKRVDVRLGPADDQLRPNGDEDPETFQEKLAELEAAKLVEGNSAKEVNHAGETNKFNETNVASEVNKVEEINKTSGVNESSKKQEEPKAVETSEAKEPSKAEADKA